MTKIFISYTRSDSEIVLGILSELQEVGYDIWVDARGIRGGSVWRDEVGKGIKDCDVFVVFMSNKSLASNYVIREIDAAFEYKKKIIPVLLDTVDVFRADSRLGSIQPIDYRIPNWKSQLLVSLGPSRQRKRDIFGKNTRRLLSVFLCHSSGDKPKARELYSKLEDESWIDPWLDEEKLLPGVQWDLEIKKAVKAADIVIVCLSRGSISKEGYIQKEIRYVLDVAEEKPDGTIFVIPLKLEACEVPDRLSPWQWLNYKEENAYEKLHLSLLKRALSLGISVE